MKKIFVINGPNLNLLGIREPNIYGELSFEAFLIELKAKYPDISLDFYQTNIEGEIINKLHEIGFSYNGIILNAGGYSHTSVAIADAIKSISTPVIEVHISNTFSREDFRHQSILAPNCKGIIVGFGLKGYELALEGLIR